MVDQVFLPWYESRVGEEENDLRKTRNRGTTKEYLSRTSLPIMNKEVTEKEGENAERKKVNTTNSQQKH
jgi:hypothetical protein